jgi:hypothetical protein
MAGFAPDETSVLDWAKTGQTAGRSKKREIQGEGKNANRVHMRFIIAGNFHLPAAEIFGI